MKSKAPLALIELVIMLLIFALCSALCLKGLVSAEMTKRADSQRDSAIICIRNTAEMVKYCRGDLPADTFYDSDFNACGEEEAAYVVHVEKNSSGSDYLGLADITICRLSDGTNEAVAQLTAAWQNDSTEAADGPAPEDQTADAEKEDRR